jgi:oligopeptide/dipeptide ABC transporter ATP-binding protein
MGRNLLVLRERQLQAIRGARIAMVYQEPGTALNPVLRIGNQITEVLRAHMPLSRTQAKDEAKALLAQVGLGSNSGISEAYPHQLSGGEKQRAVIAQAIACHPDLVIADEPTAALDSVTQTEILNLLRRLQTKLQMALILISHDPSTLEHMVDRILVMYAGRLVEDGPIYDVLLEPMHPYTTSLLRSWPATTGPQRFRQVLPVIPGEPPNLAHLPAGCAFEPRCPEGKNLCRTRVPQEWQPEASRRVACFNYGH